MGRPENIEVFENTMDMCRTEPELVSAIKAANSAQSLIPEYQPVELEVPRRGRKADIIVSRKRTLEAAADYARDGKKVCVLNFASASNPGGGVKNGSSAQEEALCRCSTLYSSLIQNQMWGGFYAPHRSAHDPLHNDDCIYTPGVVAFKTDTSYPRALPKDQWYSVNVVTCAAPNLREKPTNSMNYDGHAAVKISDADLRKLHEKRLERILSVAALDGNDVVILGAFGCGAFMNPPEVVAQGMIPAIEKFREYFDTIELAIYCSPRDDTNFRVFDRVMKLLK